MNNYKTHSDGEEEEEQEEEEEEEEQEQKVVHSVPNQLNTNETVGS